MTDYAGPEFELVDQTPADQVVGQGGAVFSKPILVKGAVRAWPAWERWSFDRLAELRRPDSREVVCQFQDGLVEQGATEPLPTLPVAPFLRELGEASRAPLPGDVGLLPTSRLKRLVPGERFRLNWAHLRSFKPNRRYLADWPILSEFPQLRRDFAIRTLWPGRRWTWEYVFIGPANTVTGLHQDIHDNWFCQVRGTKELLLLSDDQTPHMRISKKYNHGSVLSEIDISKLGEQPEAAEDFGKTRGYYARAEAGDALFIPKHTWHAVVALEPSISLGVFGLTALEVATAGAWAEMKKLLHLMRLYKWGNCICHESP